MGKSSDQSPASDKATDVPNDDTVVKYSNNNQSSTSQLITDVAAHPNFQGSWKDRHRIVFLSLSFFATCLFLLNGAIAISLLSWAIGRINDISPVISITVILIIGNLTAITTIIGSYVFGVSFDTDSFRKNIGSLANLAINKDKV